MKKPSHPKLVRSILIFLILSVAAPLLGVGLRWVAARSQRAAANRKFSATSSTASGIGPKANKSGASSAIALDGCALNCTATVPATGQVGASIGFAATASPTGCAATPTFEWNFGDNTPTASAQNPSHVYTAPGSYGWTLTTRTSGGGAAVIDTVAGGRGEGDPPSQVSFESLAAVARDPLGRGIFLAEVTSAGGLIRFINLSGTPATIAGVTIAPGTIRQIAGGGLDTGENARGLDSDLGNVTGLAVSPDGQLIYYIDDVGHLARAINATNASLTINGASIGSGNIGSLATPSGGFGTNLNGLSVNPSNGDLYIADATIGVNKVYRITPAGAVTVAAGNGASSMADTGFSPGAATSTPLLLPRAVKADASGNLFIADTGHGRVIKVDSGGNASLVVQFGVGPVPPNPYPSGLALLGGNLYVANGNALTIMRVTGGSATVAGTAGTACDYSTSNCGDGGPGAQATLNLQSSINTPPLAGIDSDGVGLFILDQGAIQRSRVRYLNLSAGAVTVAGVTIASNQIDTIAGAGLKPPYDQSLATSGTLNSPVGVAATPQGDLFIADTISNRLRFVHRGSSPLTIFPGTPSEQTVGANQIVTINKDAGTGAGDASSANTAFFEAPQGMTVTAQGVFIADSRRGPNVPATIQGKRTGLIRYINTTSSNVTFYSSSSFPIVIPPGFVFTIAGGGTNSSGSGDGGFATDARLYGPSDVAVSPTSGDIYIADVGNKSVRKINRNTGVISSLTLPAAQYTGLGFDASGVLYVVNTDAGSLLRETAPASGSFTTLATGLSKPRDVAIDANGVAYVTSNGNHRVLQVNSAGVVSTLAGTTVGFAGDGGAAASARLNLTTPQLSLNSSTNVPETVGISIAPSGDVFFTDSGNNRVRRVSLGGGSVTCVRTGTITIAPAQNPAPTVTSLSPNAATAGAAGFTLTINGTNFVAGAVARWNGSDRTTGFVSATQLTAQIPAADVAAGGAASVTVFNPAPGGGSSNTLNFTVNNPTPQLSSLSPNQTTAGGAAFTLTINGSNFVTGAIAQVNGANRSVTPVSGTQITTQIQASDIAAAGAASIVIVNPSPGGGASNALSLAINNPTPSISDLSPNTVTPGGAAFTLTVNGSNFVNGSVVKWNGADRTTTFVNATKLTAAIPASDITSAGAANVTVVNPVPGGGTSNSSQVAINNQTPSISDLSPNAATVGGAAFTLTVNGSNFINGSVVKWNGADRTTTFMSATKLTAAIPAADIAAAGSASVTVTNPAPGGGASNTVNFAINNPAPGVSGLSPNQATVGAAGFTLTVNGSNFINGSVVRWNGADRATTFVGATQVTAAIPASDLSAAGAVSVTVFNPAPGGGVSSASTFTVNNPTPQLSGLSPNQATAGAAAFTLTISGTNFVAGSVARWNGSDRTTGFVSATQLTAQVTAADVASAGSASVTVFNPGPGGGASNALSFTINPPQSAARIVRVVNSGAAPGGPVSAPIELVSQGDENAVSFSLSFPTASLGAPQVALGAGAAGGALNVNTAQTADGRIGVSLALPAGQKFAAGARQIAVVTFTIAANAPAGPIQVTFTNQPILLEAADINAAPLSLGSASGVITVTPGFEGDVAPRPNGNGSLTISDWVMLGRFATGLETAAAGGEFQRVDCAPRGTLGDGAITLSDWVQGGRYAAGLDPVTPAGGPSAPTSGVQQTGGLQGTPQQLQAVKDEQSRSARSVSAVSAEPNLVMVYLDAKGDENAIGFSLQYDPAQVRFAGAELGPDAKNATLLINMPKGGSGQVGVTLALPAGQSLRAGSVGLLTAHFTIAPGAAPSVTRVNFGDAPVKRDAVDTLARSVASNWQAADLTVNARGQASASAASFSADALAPESIVAAFGDRLATATRAASALPLPFELAGTRVLTRDSAGLERSAPIFFVSPTQINYLLPSGMAIGPATVTITSGDGGVYSEVIQIAPSAPGLFTANADGQGVAAALALRVKPDGTGVYQPVARMDSALGRYVSSPVDLGGNNDQVYLVLFGTGFRSGGSPDSIKATVGGVDAQATYVGAQGGYAGLDQINLRLPRILLGHGETEVRLTVDGRAVNVVGVNIR